MANEWEMYLDASDTILTVYKGRGVSDQTLTAYIGDWYRFSLWCSQHGIDRIPAPLNQILRYSYEARSEGVSEGTIRRWLLTISTIYKYALDDNFLADAILDQTRRDREPVLNPRSAFGLARMLGTDTAKSRRDALLLQVYANVRNMREIAEMDSDPSLSYEYGETYAAWERVLRAANVGGTKGVALVMQGARVGGSSSGPLFRAVNRHGHVSANRLTYQSIRRIIAGYGAFG